MSGVSGPDERWPAGSDGERPLDSTAVSASEGGEFVGSGRGEGGLASRVTWGRICTLWSLVAALSLLVVTSLAVAQPARPAVRDAGFPGTSDACDISRR